MTDLPSLLLSAIEETEDLARQAATDGINTWKPEDPAFWWNEDYSMSRSERHLIARFDPAAVLRRCAADRKLIALHPKGENGLGGSSCMCCEERTDYGHSDGEWPCDTLLALAEGYGLDIPVEGETR